MRLREFDDSDVAEGVHGPAADGQNWQRTLIAEEAGEHIGLGTMVLSTLHRDCFYLEIQVVPEMRRRGVGRTLFRALMDSRPCPYPVLTRATAAGPAGAAFAAAMGFEVLMRCPAPQLNPASTAAAHWIEHHRSPAGVRVVPARQRPFEELLEAWAELFVWIHEDWSPVYDRERVRELFAASGWAELDLDLSQVAVRSDRIVAMTCVLPEVWDSRSYLVTETVQRHCCSGVEILAATIAGALRACAARGITFVEFDGHAVDPHFYPLSTTLPIIGSDPMLVMRHPGQRLRISA